MCARFSLAGPERIADRYPQFRLRNVWPRRYNIAPTQDVLAARGDAAGEIAPLRWGLVPFWARDLTMGQKLINARVETLAEKPAFRSALQKRRCIIFADGFYEWTGGKGNKQPHRYTVDGGAPFAFAGLWERWGPKDAPVETCTIVTCAPNRLCAAVHDRMPAILDDDALDAWLHGDVGDALAAIAPYDAARMRQTPVTPQMNHHAFEDPRCIEPFAAATHAPAEQALLL
ncbi:MAG: hypothetical protein QOJ39_2111 [Candidatus Eremiobacteraeota bacterium]|jgi:putative SOS response-associated peptidase YedK|nr:hypothetical protein [Candidatus Eremiobacteraeota bacterium]